MTALTEQASEILIDHYENISKKRVWDGEFREELNTLIGCPPPETGNDTEEILDQLVESVFRFTLNLGHPKCFGFVPSSPTWPSVIADFMAAGFNSNVCTWLSASGPSQIELIVINWIRNWIGYPDSAGGLFTSGSSVASIEAFAAARQAAENPERATIYMSDQTHYSLVRAARIIGIQSDCIKKIASDDNFVIDMNALTETVLNDIANGYAPIIIIANAGTTGTGAVDPIEQISEFCQSQSIWFHIDAAYGGFACITDRGKRLLKGMERADSITLDAHKWLFQTYESGCLMVKNLDTLEDFYGMKPDILQDTIWGSNHPNIANRGAALSRSFRALKVWMSVKMFGMKLFRESVNQGLDLARKAENYINESDYLEISGAVVLSIVCFRFNPTEMSLDKEEVEKINQAILANLFWDTDSFISSTLLKGKYNLRLCVLNYSTTWNDIQTTLEAVEQFGIEQTRLS